MHKGLYWHVITYFVRKILCSIPKVVSKSTTGHRIVSIQMVDILTWINTVANLSSLWHFLHGHTKNIWHSYTYSYTYIKNLSSLHQTYWVYGASPIVVIPVGIQWVMWSTVCQISLHGTHLAQQCHKIYVMHTYFISATNLHDTLTYSNITKCNTHVLSVQGTVCTRVCGQVAL